MSLELTPEKIKIFYLKRWASLSVKLLRIEQTIKQSTSPQTQAYLREYFNIIKENKKDEQDKIIYLDSFYNYE